MTVSGVSGQSVQRFDFESGSSAYAGADLRSVGGFEGVGSAGREISGMFAYADQKDVPIVLNVSELGAHETLDIEFSLALIDSWDGERPGQRYAPDFIAVVVDGVEVFRESFTNFEGDVWAASYSPERRSAYGAYYNTPGWMDSVYDISITGVSHTGPSATIEFRATGSGYEGGMNEAFAIDNVVVTALPAPGAVAVLGLLLFGPRRFRR